MQSEKRAGLRGDQSGDYTSTAYQILLFSSSPLPKVKKMSRQSNNGALSKSLETKQKPHSKIGLQTEDYLHKRKMIGTCE